MGENRLFKKFIISYVCFVLLPFSAVLAGVMVYANRLQLKNDMIQNEILASQMVNAISRQTELAENMCSSLIFLIKNTYPLLICLITELPYMSL